MASKKKAAEKAYKKAVRRVKKGPAPLVSKEAKPAKAEKVEKAPTQKKIDKELRRVFGKKLNLKYNFDGLSIEGAQSLTKKSGDTEIINRMFHALLIRLPSCP